MARPREVYEQPRTEFVADFVGASNRIGAAVLGRNADGSYEAELDGVGRVRARGVADLSAETPVCAIVRPEAIVPQAPADGCAGITARITDLAYLGHHVACVLETDGGEQVTISVRQAGASLVVGAQCELSWPFDAIWLLPVRAAQ